MNKPYPWSKNDARIQIAVVLAALIYGTVALGIIHPILGAAYPTLLGLFVVVNQRFICRDCAHYGTLCGSFAMGRVRLFRPTGKEQFDINTARKVMAFFYLVCLYPVLFLWMLEPFYLWVGIYLLLLAAGFYLHYRRGCAKCDLTHCNYHPDYRKTYTRYE